ncbi:hypothetical protein ACS0TY_023424 [Phlomoides rotata]
MASIGVASSAKRLLLSIMIMALNFTLLAAESGRFSDDTVRVDPLDKLKKYRGGYDITNKHYWGSTAFTGIYGYVLAVVWLLCGVGYGVFVVVKRTCMNSRNLKKRRPYHKNCNLHQPLLLGLVFTLLAIIGSGLVLGGNAEFHSRAKTVIDVIIDTADDASDTIYSTTGAMKDMVTRLRDVNADPEETRFLTSTSRRLDSQADDIARQASKNRRLIDKILNIVYIITTAIISLTLVTIIALLVLGVLKFQRTVQVLIALCWTFTVCCWLFFGIYFFLQNFSKDTCTAIESFQQDPYNNSLSSFLPCDELVSARSVLTDVSKGIYDIVNEVNYNISTQYGNVVQICNPFSPPPLHEYQPWNCPSTSVHIGDIPQVLRLLVCPDSEGEKCNGGILIPAIDYNRVEAYTTSIQKLLDVYPGMESLVECQTVKDAFSEILNKHCTPLKRNVRMVWASLVFLSVVMVAMVLVWTIATYHDIYHHYFDGSVKPHSTTTDMLESGPAEINENDSTHVVEV